jgi:type I restriction-modification system DNA methylase subunit
LGHSSGRNETRINECLSSKGEKMKFETEFETARKLLISNPSEGQVEQSVVTPILTALGYSDILNKVSVRVKIGCKDYEWVQSDIIAKGTNLPTLVVEAKSPNKGLTLPNDYSQGLSYCFSPDVNTRFLFLTSGYSNRLYEADKLLFEFDLKSLFQNIEYFKNCLLGTVTTKEKLPSKTNINDFFNFAHNRMWAEDAIKPAEVLKILTKIFLIKTNEERGRSLYNLRSVLEYKGEYEKLSASQEMDKKRLEIEDSIFTYISDCLKNIDTDLLYPEERVISRNISVNTLFEIIHELYTYAPLDYISTELKGSAFDSFLNRTLKGRELGQIFTHRNIVHFMVSIVDPKLSDNALDPACGTGGFIENVFLVLKRKLGQLYNEDTPEYKTKLMQLQNNQIFGIEKDGSVASLAKLSMSMNGDGHTTIYRGNGLLFTNQYIHDGAFGIVLTNPPFGSKSVVQIQDKEILSKYDLGKKYVYNASEHRYVATGQLLDGQDIGVLFLERCIKLLKEGGTLGIILHDGVFSNSTTPYIRQYIREHCKITAIIKLPDETFKPYNDSAAIETSILFCKKGKETDDDTCFFGIAETVGYKFKRKTMIEADNDLDDLINAFKNNTNYKNSKWVKLSEIPIYERLDPQYYIKQINFSSTNYIPLKELLLEPIKTGVPYASKYFGKGDIRMVKIKQINNSLLNLNELVRLPREYYDTCNNVSLMEEDILLGMDGKKEFRASFVDNEVLDIAVNQRIAIIRIDKEKISPAYVFFVLISPIGQKQLMRDKTQTATVAHLSNDIIENIKIPIIDEDMINKIDDDFKEYVKSLRDTQEAFKNIAMGLD